MNCKMTYNTLKTLEPAHLSKEMDKLAYKRFESIQSVAQYDLHWILICFM